MPHADLPLWKTSSLCRYHRICAYLVVGILGAPPQANHANATTSAFSGYTSICLSIFDLTRDHDFKFRDDISDRIAPVLDKKAHDLLTRMRVYSRPACARPSEFKYPSQISLELSVKRQTLSVDEKQYNVAVIGGSSSNVRAPLSDYELQPIILIQTTSLSDDVVEKALADYVETRVLSLIKKQPSK